MDQDILKLTRSLAVRGLLSAAAPLLILFCVSHPSAMFCNPTAPSCPQVVSLQLEMEAVYGSLEDEALEIAPDVKGSRCGVNRRPLSCLQLAAWPVSSASGPSLLSKPVSA